MADSNATMDILDDDPAIGVLKALFSAEVERVKDSVVQDSRNLIASEHEKSKKKIERVMVAFKEKFDSLKQELVTDLEEKIKSLKIDLLKEFNLKKKTVKDADDSDSNDDDDEDEGEGEDEQDLSDFETRLWGKSYGAKRSKPKQKKGSGKDENEEDEEEDDEAPPPPKKRGRKKGSKNKTLSKPQLAAELAKLEGQLKKKK